MRHYSNTARRRSSVDALNPPSIVPLKVISSSNESGTKTLDVFNSKSYNAQGENVSKVRQDTSGTEYRAPLSKDQRVALKAVRKGDALLGALQ